MFSEIFIILHFFYFKTKQKNAIKMRDKNQVMTVFATIDIFITCSGLSLVMLIVGVKSFIFLLLNQKTCQCYVAYFFYLISLGVSLTCQITQSCYCWLTSNLTLTSGLVFISSTLKWLFFYIDFLIIIMIALSTFLKISSVICLM